MTLRQFERYMKRANPKLRVRIRGYGDVAGIFAGKAGKTGYICRLGKGEMHLSGFRHQIIDPENKFKLTDGNIQKRGRKTAVTFLRDWRWLTKHKDRSRILWGLKD